MGIEESEEIAELIIKALVNHNDQEKLQEVKESVRAITERFPLYENL